MARCTRHLRASVAAASLRERYLIAVLVNAGLPLSSSGQYWPNWVIPPSHCVPLSFEIATTFSILLFIRSLLRIRRIKISRPRGRPHNR